MKTRPTRRVDLRHLTAYHEAGHAVLSAAINDAPALVSIRARDGTLGRSTQKMFSPPSVLIQVFLAGFVAEHLLTGRRSRQLDQELGLSLLARNDRRLGDAFAEIRGSDGWCAMEQALRGGARDVDEEIRAVVERFYEIARESLSQVWPAVTAVALVLLDREELDRDEFEETLATFPIYTPVFEVQARYGLMSKAGRLAPFA